MNKKEKTKNKRKTHLIKNKGLRRVCAVVCLCFALFAVALPFTRSSGNLRVSAASTPAAVPEKSYIISFNISPSLYCSWAQFSEPVTTLLTSPTVYISDSGFYVGFGANIYNITNASNDNSAIHCESYFYRYTGSAGQVVNPTVPDKFGFSARLGSAAAYTPSEFYSKLIAGDLVISNIKYDNVCVRYSDTEYDNYFSYTIQCPNDMGVNFNALIVYCYRQDTLSKDFEGFTASSYDTNFPFTYVITYNGLSTSSQEYQAGYIDGQQSGSKSGYDTGYKAGFSAGDTAGYNRGVNEKFSDITPWQTIVNGVDSFFKIEILPKVSIALILSVGFGCILLGMAIKIFLGG